MYISAALPGLAGNQAGLVCAWESWREYVRAMAGVVRMCHIENRPLRWRTHGIWSRPDGGVNRAWVGAPLLEKVP